MDFNTTRQKDLCIWYNKHLFCKAFYSCAWSEVPMAGNPFIYNKGENLSYYICSKINVAYLYCLTCSIPGVSGLNKGRVSMCSGTKWNPYLGTVCHLLNASSARGSFVTWVTPISSTIEVFPRNIFPPTFTLLSL